MSENEDFSENAYRCLLPSIVETVSVSRVVARIPGTKGIRKQYHEMQVKRKRRVKKSYVANVLLKGCVVSIFLPHRMISNINCICIQRLKRKKNKNDWFNNFSVFFKVISSSLDYRKILPKNSYDANFPTFKRIHFATQDWRIATFHS